MVPRARRPLSPDTPLEVEWVWLDGIRAQGPNRQGARMIEMSAFCRQAARHAVAQAHPEASEAERDEILLRELYGDAEAAREVVRRRTLLGFYAGSL
jgi:hypothetical protein